MERDLDKFMKEWTGDSMTKQRITRSQLTSWYVFYKVEKCLDLLPEKIEYWLNEIEKTPKKIHRLLTKEFPEYANKFEIDLGEDWK